MEVVLRALALTTAVALGMGAGCNSWVEESEDGLRHLSDVRLTNNRGRINLRIPVLAGETAMLITADPISPFRAVFIEAEAPGGEVLYDVDADWESGLLKTGARYATSVVNLNWPIIPADPDLREGLYKVEIAAVDTASNYAGGVEMDLDVLLKQDPSFEDGVVVASLIFAGSADTDPELERAVVAAVDIWTDLYAVMGIDLEVEWFAAPGVTSLPTPGDGGGDLYEAMTAGTGIRTVDVIIAPELENAAGVFGQAGGIPGALVPTQRSGVAVSALTNSGPDLVFNGEEVRLLAETMAHEVGHYLGLFHPVEDTWDKWDALDDTEDCDSEAVCISAFRDNLMFPYPVCTQSACTPQDQLTPDQSGVANRYTAVE